MEELRDRMDVGVTTGSIKPVSYRGRLVSVVVWNLW